MTQTEPHGALRTLRTGAAALLLTALAALAAIPAGEAAPPFDELNDVQWCVDQTSQAVRGVIQAYAGAALQTWDDNYRSLKCKLHQHPPIAISGSLAGVDPARLQAQFGITRGTGTAGDPYVIENWEIAGADSFTVTFGGSPTTTPTVQEYNQVYRSGITISQTSEHFVVSKVYVHGFHCPSGCASSPSSADSAIHLGWQAHNVRVEGSVLRDNDVGITSDGDWSGSGLWVLQGNDIRASLSCAFLYAYTAKVTGNRCESAGPRGIFRQGVSSDDEMRNNVVIGPGSGTAIEYTGYAHGMIGNNQPIGWSASSDLSTSPGCEFFGDYQRCYFTCTAGSSIPVSAWSGRDGDWPRTHALCGGRDGYCQSTPSCTGNVGTASYTEVGTCFSETVRNLGSCNQAPPATPGQTCSFSGDYGRCYFVCHTNQMVYVSASSYYNGDYPRTHATCGGVDSYCQSYGNCYGYLGRAGFNDLGVCYSETVRNDGYCSAFNM